MERICRKRRKLLGELKKNSIDRNLRRKWLTSWENLSRMSSEEHNMSPAVRSKTFVLLFFSRTCYIVKLRQIYILIVINFRTRLASHLMRPRNFLVTNMKLCFQQAVVAKPPQLYLCYVFLEHHFFLFLYRNIILLEKPLF